MAIFNDAFNKAKLICPADIATAMAHGGIWSDAESQRYILMTGSFNYRVTDDAFRSLVRAGIISISSALDAPSTEDGNVLIYSLKSKFRKK